MSRYRFLWARAVTAFDLADRARVDNIRLAARRLEGAVLLPGETLSFNGRVGSRQAPDSGFIAAPVLTDRGKVRAPGGGVCQVASTLYAAILHTDLEVRERHAHATPVPYLAPGFDATVSSVLDLRLRNPHPFAVQIRASVQGRRLVVEVWGERVPVRRARPVRETSRCYRDGAPALQVTVWRLLDEQRREKMSEDIYYLGN